MHQTDSHPQQARPTRRLTGLMRTQTVVADLFSLNSL
jgi:hypothetical protein